MLFINLIIYIISYISVIGLLMLIMKWYGGSILEEIMQICDILTLFSFALFVCVQCC